MKALTKLSRLCVILIGLMVTTASNAKVVGLWGFDEGAGQTAKDSSGNDNDGQLMGDTRWVNGKFGSALQFDGALDYVEVLHDATLDITKELSIVAWAKFDEIPARENVLLDKGPKAGDCKVKVQQVCR